MERLQKYIARCGIASRRKAEQLILEGRVKVNGKVVTEMGIKVSENDIVTVDDVQIEALEKKYFVMNKPRYLITSTTDDKGRDTVISILPKSYQEYRLFPVGRLDYDTKGVLLLTNDGEFMNLLVGPQSQIEKEYLVRVKGIVTKQALKKLASGVKIDNYVTRKCKTYLESIDRKNDSSLVGIILQEGKYHQIKKMFSALGYEVKRLTRIRFGNITIDTLKEGEVRELKIHEVKTLRVLAMKGQTEKK
ncbi:MAG TPA: rRNA pseudouridine synthase [Acholeplasmataceae bacterium]|jgi:23S rRNA pseudouridine2605 synthase|nr:rRNA pseudouridine synthase [Acholeplasmataceae bacterium]